MEGLKRRVGFVAIGAYGGNQGELFYKAGYPVVFINTARIFQKRTNITFQEAKDAVRTAINQKQYSVKTWTTW